MMWGVGVPNVMAPDPWVFIGIGVNLQWSKHPSRLITKEEFESFNKATIRQGSLEIFIANHYEHTWENGKIERYIYNSIEVVIVLVLSENKDEKDVRDNYEYKLDQPSPEGHVDVQDIPLLSLSDHVRLKKVGAFFGVLDDVAEGQRVEDHLRYAKNNPSPLIVTLQGYSVGR